MFQALKSFLVIEVLLVFGLWLFRRTLHRTYTTSLPRSAVGVILLMPAVGLFCRNVLIYDGFLMFAVAFNSRSKELLAATLVAILPLTPMLGYSVVVGGLYLAQISALTAMGAGAALGHFVTKTKRRPGSSAFDAGSLAIIGIFIFIYGRATTGSDALRNGIGYVVISGGIYLLVSRASTNRPSVERILVCLLYGAFLTSVTAVFQAGRHWVVYQTFYEALQVEVPLQSWTAAMRAGFLRTGGSMLDYSAAGLFLGTALSVTLTISRVFTKMGLVVVLGVLTAGLLATQSRGGWVAAAMGIGAVLLYQRRYALTLAMGAAGGLFVAAIKLRSPAIDASNNAEFTAEYRKQLASLGIRQVFEHPLLGQAPKSLIRNLEELTQGQHLVDFVNGHLFIAMAAGVPLFMVWTVAWFLPVHRSWRRRPNFIASAPLVGVPPALIVSPMVALLFTSLIDRNLIWPTIGLAVAAACLAPEATSVGARRADRRRLVAASPRAA